MGIKTKKNTRGFGMGVILRLSCTWGTFPGATGPVSIQLIIFRNPKNPTHPENREVWNREV